MTMVVLDKLVERRLIAQRRAWGVDQHDEVWEGVYVMSPSADNEHQSLVMGITSAFHSFVSKSNLGQVLPGANISDRESGWKKNFRTPDVVVVLRGSEAKDCKTFWTGPVDFLVEVVSRGDRSKRKLPFYSKIGVRELLIVDRQPWRLTLYRHDGEQLVSVGTSAIGAMAAIQSDVLPFSFELIAGAERPQIRITGIPDGERWLA
ncbi:MAG: Uma2 family endonuclease [Pirellulales bacterium]